jgi:hypothetical protein
VSLYTDNYAEGYQYQAELESLDYQRDRYSGQQVVDFEPTVLWHKRGAPYSGPFELTEI